MEKQSRHLSFITAAAYKTRKEEYNGREHIVVPVIALMEGVVQAMNAGKPEFVPGDELRPAGWNGRPIFLGHPLVNGRPISGNTPSVLETSCIGIVFNAAIKSNKLTMEAWIDVEKATEVAPTLLERVRDDEPIEISVGVFTETDDTTGEYNGKKYRGAWHDIVPDHLALLPEGTLGACSRDMGCGVRAAAKGEAMAEAKKGQSLIGRMLAMFRSTQPAAEMSDQDVRRKIMDALRELEPNAGNIEAVYDNWFVYCNYSYMGDGPSRFEYYTRAFTLGENGAVAVDANRVEVEPVLYYEPVLMNEEPTAAAGRRHNAKDQGMVQAMHDHAIALGAACEVKAAATGAPCGCRNNEAPLTAGDNDMEKTELVKFLETATPEQLKALTDAAEGKVTEKIVEKIVEVPAAAAEPKAVTFDEVLATASADVRDSINEGLRVGREKKAATIKALKDTGRCDLTDEQLNARSQGDLDQLVKLAGSNVRAAIDFGGQGAPKTDAEKQGVPAAPDMGAAIRANAAAQPQGSRR